MKRNKILQSAEQCICHDRQVSYGDAKKDFSFIADLWGLWLDAELTAVDVAVMMALLKVGRMKNGAVKDDNYIDAIGYITLAGEIATEEDIEKDAIIGIDFGSCHDLTSACHQFADKIMDGFNAVKGREEESD